MGIKDIFDRSVKGVGILGGKVVDQIKYRQSSEFQEAQIKKLQLRNRILKEQEEAAKRMANIRNAQVRSRGGNPMPMWGNMIPGPFGSNQYNPNQKRKR